MVKIKRWRRMNPTRPFVEGVHIKRHDPEFLKWFDEHQENYADWFVERVKRGNTHCVARAVSEWEKAGGGQ